MARDNIWRPMSHTSWLDGRDVVLLAHGMEVQARFCPGEWSADTPIAPAEFSGAVWSCFDDQFQIEIEETGHDPEGWWHGAATHWRDLTDRPASADTHPKGGDSEAAPFMSGAVPAEEQGDVQTLSPSSPRG